MMGSCEHCNELSVSLIGRQIAHYLNDYQIFNKEAYSCMIWSFTATMYNKIFSGYQPRQMAEWQKANVSSLLFFIDLCS
jgi:hypothetical protein